MLLSKSDFLKYRQCPQYFWMDKYRAEALSVGPVDPFVQQIIDQGNEVEEWARKLFPDGFMIQSWKEEALADTQAAIASGKRILFQPAFVADGLLARVDVLERTASGWNIYEVKGTTAKQKKKEAHYWDAIFQREVLTRAGYQVNNIFLIELDKSFVKDGEIDPNQLLKMSNITTELHSMNEEIRQEINLAKAHLAQIKEPTACQCDLKSRKNQCPAFSYFSPQFPAYAVHDLARISEKKLSLFKDENIVAVEDIPATFKLTDNQRNQVWTYQNDQTIIRLESIRNQLSRLVYPLYFLDYETYPTAVPVFDGCYPFQQVPFQYSLHILDAPDGDYIHKEYLHREADSPTRSIAKSLCADIGAEGSVIVWNKKFERKCNEDLANMYPDLSSEIDSINNRLFDLMEVFSEQNYVHKDFKGSASIKKVLPVICPNLTYDNLAIADGGAACSSWKKMVFEINKADQKEAIAQDLLAYCKLDTWAMVRIWEELEKLVA